jgi:hypothetical protein
VWGLDQETAIQSPTGGTKITWDGRPLPPKTGKYRRCHPWTRHLLSSRVGANSLVASTGVVTQGA